MATVPVLVDPSKTGQQLLMEEVNRRNSTTLDYTDFNFGVPEAATLPGSDINTKITITAKDSGLLYGAGEFFYKRLNLAQVLAAPVGFILPGNKTHLSELITDINYTFGIGLSAADYIEADLPVYSDEDTELIPRVLVKAKTSSILFYGEHLLALGPVTPDTSPLDPDLRYYIHTGGHPSADFAKALVCIDKNGVVDTDFSLFQNATPITLATIQKFFLLNDGTMALNGTFTLTYLDNTSTPVPITNAHTLFIRKDGSISSHSAGYKFNADPDIKYYTSYQVPYRYVVDNANTAKTNRIYRYNQAGVLDSSYTCQAGYVPALMALEDGGLLYTCSAVFTAPILGTPTAQLRIDRYLANGAPDTDFEPVIITARDATAPLTITQIFPLQGNGFWALFLPLFGVSATVASPRVNGVALVPTGVTDIQSWNPIMRINNDGIRVTSFQPMLKDHQENSVYVHTGSGLAVGNNPLIVTSDTVGFLSYRDNPITGFRHRQPIMFSDTGIVKLMSGQQYFDEFRWAEAFKVVMAPDYKFVSFGKLLIKNMSGGWNGVRNAVGRYSRTGVAEQVIYSKPLTTDGGDPLTIINVVMAVVESID